MKPLDSERTDIAHARARFRAACAGERVDRPPVWIRGAAGGYLPEIQDAFARESFDAIVANPDRAAELALLPFERYAPDGVRLLGDGAVIAAALGVPCSRDGRGAPRFPTAMADEHAMATLEPERVDERLAPFEETARAVRSELGDRAAILGFATAPFSLAAQLVEGGPPTSHVRIKSMFYTQRKHFDALAEALIDATIRAIRIQLTGGVDAIAIDDPSAFALDPRAYWYASGQWIRRIVDATPDVPKILWSTGASGRTPDLRRTRAEVLGIDDPIPIARFHDELGGVRAVEGNLDPEFLALTPEIARDETKRMLDEVGGRRGFLANLARPLPENAQPECVTAFVDAVKSWRPSER